ncbi:hypothetical protein [Sphingomonas sp. Leaf242]|uniref:hypothetical protein n=1 Tax=Sphingomonas sp. Leaf242 TaxID=1736304 RepID=UPI0007156659|nr:hypothetical protein [Sphingomonas sp. Leaf242]KQO06768.1 hypothetical protein ASF09_10825 [Sphingomonas sp. Leaf242]
MIDAKPETIKAEAADLRSLASALTGYTISVDHGRISALWLWRSGQAPLLVTSDSRDIVFKFEVFTLAIQAPLYSTLREGEQEAVGRAVKWPFFEWRVDVLWIHDWSIPVEALPDGWYSSSKDRFFGQVPAGAEHTCLVAKALLFTGSDGSRLIIDQGEMPLDLYVTTDPKFINQAISDAMLMPLDRYLEGAVPTVRDDMLQAQCAYGVDL